MPHRIELLSTFLFSISIVHTFSIKLFRKAAAVFSPRSAARRILHGLGEVEIVFGIWGLVFVIALFASDSHSGIRFVRELDLTEPLFVFIIMAVASTTPVAHFANTLIEMIARVFPDSEELAFYFTALTLGPLLGSFITEPAAMTVTAVLLRERFFDRGVSKRFMYATLGVLLVNVSIGGVLTSWAAPPVVMVAHTWNWTGSVMFTLFGWKAILAVLVNAFGVMLIVRRELMGLKKSHYEAENLTPLWLQLVCLGVLITVVLSAEYALVFLAVFLLFGVVSAALKWRVNMQLKRSAMVGFFLSGIVIFGGLQRWWLEPLLAGLNSLSLFLGTTALTAVTDNAALTYLGSQIPSTSEIFRYALLAGAVTGGGLTVIANAPNPAGFAILEDSFGKDGISPLRLFLAALFPTLVAALFFWLLR